MKGQLYRRGGDGSYSNQVYVITKPETDKNMGFVLGFGLEFLLS